MEFREVEGKVNHYMSLLENELGNDATPILIIIMCRMCVKYNLDIEWVTATIKMGYHNELPPVLTDDDDGPVRYDS